MRAVHWVLVAVGLLAVGCGGNGETAQPAAEPAESEPAAAGQDVAADQTLADQSVLTAADLAGDWSSQPRDDEEDDPEGDEIFNTVMRGEPACDTFVAEVDRRGESLSGFELAPDAPARAESPTLVFEPAQLSEVEHTVSVFPTVAEARATFELMRELEYPECVTAFFDDVMQAFYDVQGSGIEVTGFEASHDTPAFGDDALHGRMELSLAASDGSAATLTIDVSGIATGRAVSGLIQLSFANEVDLDTVARTAFEKVERNFG